MTLYGLTLLTLLLLESDVRTTADSAGRKPQRKVFNEDMKIVVGPLQKCEPKMFVGKTIKQAEWKCVLLLKLHCFDTSKPKDMSVVQNGVAVRRSVIRCLIPGEVISSGEMAGEEGLNSTKLVKNRLGNP